MPLEFQLNLHLSANLMLIWLGSLADLLRVEQFVRFNLRIPEWSCAPVSLGDKTGLMEGARMDESILFGD